MRQIFELYETGQYSLRSLPQELTRRGYTSLQGNAFNTQTPSVTSRKIPNIRAVIAATKPNRWTTAKRKPPFSMKASGCPIPIQYPSHCFGEGILLCTKRQDCSRKMYDVAFELRPK